MFVTLRLHQHKLLLVFGLALTSLLANSMAGDARPWTEVDWLDVFGEGGSAIAIATWMVLILGSRPAGRVTDLLTLGLGFMFLAMWQDNLDEFFRMPSAQWWGHWLESVAMPLGIGLLTYGLFHWHREQLSINRQLQKREALFREHRFIDGLTQLGRADYLKRQLYHQFMQEPEQSLTLAMVEVAGFRGLLRQIGHREADRLLREVAEIMLLNIRPQDVICRYSGERFAIVMPATNEQQAAQLLQEVAAAIRHFAFKTGTPATTCFQHLVVGHSTASGAGQVDRLITTANQALQKAQNGLLDPQAA